MPRANTGPHLAPGKGGVWDISFTVAGRSRRRSAGTTDRLQAQKVLAAFLVLEPRDIPEARTDLLMVRDVLGDPEAETGADYWHEHVLEHVVGKETQRYAVVKLTAHFGPIEVRRVLPSDVAAYVRKRRAGQIGHPSVDGTIARELSVLNAAIVHAVKAKRLDRSDAPTVELPRAAEPKDRWLTHDEADRLLTAALSARTAKDKLPRVYRFIAIALATASRKTAVLELRREQIDMDNGMIRLNPIGRRQTKKRRPAVPISDDLKPIMARVLEETTGDLVLDHAGSIRTSFNTACTKAGLPDVTPHTLRHTWATWAAQAGVDMWQIAGVLGDTMETVVRNYAHHSPEHLRAAVNAVKRRAA